MYRGFIVSWVITGSHLPLPLRPLPPPRPHPQVRLCLGPQSERRLLLPVRIFRSAETRQAALPGGALSHGLSFPLKILSAPSSPRGPPGPRSPTTSLLQPGTRGCSHFTHNPPLIAFTAAELNVCNVTFFFLPVSRYSFIVLIFE